MAKREQILPRDIKDVCHHCGNTVPLKFVSDYSGKPLVNEYDELNHYLLYKCLTCEKPSIYALEDYIADTEFKISDYDLMYPIGANLSKNVPKNVLTLYNEAYHLRQKSPNAFANQIRIALEMICEQQEAKGKTLHHQLEDLAEKGRLPGQIKELAILIKLIGNIGSHNSKSKLTLKEAELIKEIFLSVVEYIYDAPARIKALQKKIDRNKKLISIANSGNKSN